jgi:hypothetical protein
VKHPGKLAGRINHLLTQTGELEHLCRNARRLALPQQLENWSLTSLEQRLVKTGGRLVKYARYYLMLLAEGHLNRRRFGAMPGRIALPPVPAG